MKGNIRSNGILSALLGLISGALGGGLHVRQPITDAPRPFIPEPRHRFRRGPTLRRYNKSLADLIAEAESLTDINALLVKGAGFNATSRTIAKWNRVAAKRRRELETWTPQQAVYGGEGGDV